MIANKIYNHNDLRLTPVHYNSVTFSDDVCLRIACGQMNIKSGITNIHEKTVYFDNGTHADDIDAIVLCTGFTREFPFFDDDFVTLEHNGKYLPVYKGGFMPKIGKKMVFVGFDAVFGSSVITSEMQARYACEVFKGVLKLPSPDDMQKYVDEKISTLRKDFNDTVKEYNFVSAFCELLYESFYWIH